MTSGVREKGEAEDRGEKGQGDQGDPDSGPVINEESNFQAGDLTSSRPNGRYSMRDGAERGADRGGGKEELRDGDTPREWMPRRRVG